jgi:hypothetical protein
MSIAGRSGSTEDNMTYRNPARWLGNSIVLLGMVVLTGISSAQITSDNSQPTAPRSKEAELEEHLDQLTSKMDNMRQRLNESQSEISELRAELNALKAQRSEKDQSEEAAQTVASLQSGIAQIREQTDVLEAEVKQHDQTKVESATKYPVRISGMLLFTSLLNTGTPDNIDLPTVAMANPQNASAGSLGATARQTLLSLSASGPHIWGARASSELSVDFFGGAPYADYGTAAGNVRFRTGHANLEWPNRSLIVSFDRPLISPLQPTSWLSVGEPALAWSGNLWAWSPQVEFKENSILNNHHLGAEFGLIDAAAPGVSAGTGLRQPDASERSRQPGYEARLSSTMAWAGHQINLGAGGYYSRQTYKYSRHVDAWVATADWNVSLARPVELSGEFYRGRAIGGLGGGAFKDYITYASYTSLRGLNAVGGWGQLKFKILHSFEGNIAGGQDSALGRDLRNSDVGLEQGDYSDLARNQSIFGNLIFRPRPYLLLSTEFRQLKSWTITGEGYQDRILGFAGGYSF